jgi:hypothetical protein
MSSATYRNEGRLDDYNNSDERNNEKKSSNSSILCSTKVELHQQHNMRSLSSSSAVEKGIQQVRFKDNTQFIT